jgi:hypothetical protein
MTYLVKLKPFAKVFGKMVVVVPSLYFHVTCGEKAAGSHYFWLHLRSTNCKIASPWLQVGSRFLLVV